MSEKLKLLIVDDEPLSRKRICSFQLKNCRFEVAGEAEDGREALEKIDLIHPDIVVTDIVMPVMDGLDLLKEIQKRPNPPKVVILTCHEDFDKAQTALRLGAQDYIIKLMLRESEFKEAIGKIADSIFQERRERDRFLVNSLQRLMHAKTREELRQDLEYLNARNFHLACYRLLYLRVSAPPLQEMQREESEGGFRCRLVEEGEAFLTCLFYTDRLVSADCFGKKTEALLDRVNRKQEECGAVIPAKPWALVGAVYHGAGTLPEACRSLENYANRLFYEGERRKIYFQQVPAQPFGVYPQDAFLEVMEACRSFCRNGDYDRLGTYWLEWIKKLGELCPQPESARNMMCMAVSCVADSISRISMEGRTLDVWMVEKLNAVKTMREASDCFSEAARLLAAHPGAAPGTVRSEIQSALNYIAENYSSEISLKSAARHVRLSKSWFSALFKAEIHQPFSDYLIAYRIARAKELLESSDLTVSRISEAVGIPDPHYFTRIFTEKTGVGPKKYRTEARSRGVGPRGEKPDTGNRGSEE